MLERLQRPKFQKFSMNRVNPVTLSSCRGQHGASYAAVTEIHKRMNPHVACNRIEALYGLFDAEAGVHARN
jgi:hypothetical protein